MAAAPAPDGGQNNAEALQLNDEAVDMLMLLDYEQTFCSKELKPIARTFFTYPAANTAYQFKYFTQLVVWLLKMVKPAGWEADWDEYDDPNTVITNMQVLLKDVGIQVNAVPAKLKQGYGDSVCLVLHSLLREVLRRVSFEWGVPSYPDEGLADEAEVDSDAEIQSVGEDDMPGNDEEDDLMYQEDEIKKPEGDSDEDNHAVLEANVDPKEWLLEVERVAPKLKVQIPNDSKEWRTHLQQTRGYKQVIENEFPAAKAQLEKLSKELSSALERIKSKEAFINTQFDHRALDYREQQEELNRVQAQYTELNEVVMNLQIELKNVAEELDVVKSDMEERSSTVTDTAPIVKMKDAFKKLRSDTRQLEVRIGVVSHTLMQAKLRQRPQEDRKHGLYAGVGGGDHEGYDENDP
jgi:estrogen-related receptor beta like 1